MLDKQISNELKVLALEMINNAGSGHSGSVLSCVDALYTLYTRHILTDGTKNMLRDRFVMSNG
ncbi:MAG: transketolase, partial [Clostridia bacterium]|nr:transketolase [Clostridia bacterium]